MMLFVGCAVRTKGEKYGAHKLGRPAAPYGEIA
jgi:hypothetical protein